MKRERRREGGTAGLAAVIVGTVAWGSTGIFVKEIRLAALPLTFYRLWLGVVLLGALLAVRRRPLSLAVLFRSVLPGLFLAADIALFFSALKLTSVAVATVIGALQPALVLMVAGRLFGERVGWRVVIWTAVSIGGIAAVAVGPGVPRGEHLTGDALAVGSLVAFTGYWLVSKRVIGVTADSDRYTFGVMLVAAVVMTPIALLSGESLGPVRPADWFWLVLLALVPGSGHLLFNFAHRFVDVSVSSVVSAGNPIVASLLALVVLGEPLDAVQVAGGIVAVFAIAAVVAVPINDTVGKFAAEILPGRQGEQAVPESEFVVGEPCPEPGMEQLRRQLSAAAQPPRVSDVYDGQNCPDEGQCLDRR